MNNKGFTLTEVVVAVVISSVVLVSIALYSAISINQFGTTRTETQTYQEATTLLAQLNTRVTSLKNFQYINNGNGYKVFEVIVGETDDETNYTLSDYVYILDVAKTDLYLITKEVTDPDKPELQFDEATDLSSAVLKKSNMMSQYVTDLTVTPATMKEAKSSDEKTIRVGFEVKVGKKSTKKEIVKRIRNEKEAESESESESSGDD